MLDDFKKDGPITRRQSETLHDLVMFEISYLTKENAERLIDKALDGEINVIAHLGMYYDEKTLSNNK